jgi:hypothetical protein
MNNQEVEILKIGSIIPDFTIMVINDAGSIFDYYISILREECGGEYKYLKTHKNIIGGPYSYRPGKNDSRVVGKLDGELVIGMSFSIGNWHSSVVEKIVSNNIVITKNSVYAIHSLSDFRNDKLNKLGI